MSAEEVGRYLMVPISSLPSWHSLVLDEHKDSANSADHQHRFRHHCSGYQERRQGKPSRWEYLRASSS